MRKAVLLLIVLGVVAAASCGSESRPAAPSAPAEAGTSAAIVRAIVFTTTAGFRHDSIPAAMAALRSIAPSSGLGLTFTEDVSTLSADSLARFDVVVFALTSGELPLAAAAKTALLDFVSAGHGFVGVHSAADTLYEWPDYGGLVGAYFLEHPWTQRGTVVVEDRTHPSMTGIDDRFSLVEEFYTFRDNPRPRVHVLLRLDESSVGATGDYPLAWSQSVGSGRTYYNALGHFADTWNDAGFRRQIAGAIRWAAGR